MESTTGLIIVVGAIVVAFLAKRASEVDAAISTPFQAGDWSGPIDPIAAPAVTVPVVLGPQSIQEIIRAAAARFGQDAALMLAIAQTESSFNSAAVNLSDPSYGLFQIQVFWLRHFGFPGDKNLLLDATTASEVAARILQYFRARQNPLTGDTFQFPADVDVYNVGESLWAQGRRNLGYRDRVTGYYRNFGGTE